MNEIINESNFVLYAAKYYDNPQCYDTEEFYDDLKRFKYLKRLFGRYEETGEIKERLILNHLVILYNVFGPYATKMLFFKLAGFYPYLKPFIVLLGYMPEQIEDLNIFSSDINMDPVIVEKLRKI